MLPEAGYNTLSTEHTAQITDTQVLGTKAVNETRFQYLRDNSSQNPISTRLASACSAPLRAEEAVQEPKPITRIITSCRITLQSRRAKTS